MSAQAYVGDLGVALPFTARIKGVAVDLTGAALTSLFVESPAGTRAVWNAGLAVVSAAAGTFTKTLDTIASELTEPGPWKVQLLTTEGTEVKFYDPETFIVGASLATGATPLRAYNPMVWGRSSIDVAGNANVTLTAAQYSNYILHLTGLLTGAISVIVPTIDGAVWLVSNATTGAFVLTVRTVAGAGVAVTQSKRCLAYCDGTDIVQGAAETP